MDWGGEEEKARTSGTQEFQRLDDAIENMIPRPNYS
jgi:hypothetical protein